MPEITIKTPNGPYVAKLDAEAMDVEIRKAFLGIQFITEDGEKLSVCMRDSGFELVYEAKFKEPANVSLQNGIVKYRSL